MFGERPSSQASGEVHQGVVGTAGDVVEVLHADDRRDGLRLGELVSRDGTEAQVLDQPLLPERQG